MQNLDFKTPIRRAQSGPHCEGCLFRYPVIRRAVIESQWLSFIRAAFDPPSNGNAISAFTRSSLLFLVKSYSEGANQRAN